MSDLDSQRYPKRRKLTPAQKRKYHRELMRARRQETAQADMVYLTLQVPRDARDRLNECARSWGTTQAVALAYMLETYDQD